MQYTSRYSNVPRILKADSDCNTANSINQGVSIWPWFPVAKTKSFCYIWFGHSYLTKDSHSQDLSSCLMNRTPRSKAEQQIGTRPQQHTTDLSHRQGEQGERWSGWSCLAPSHQPECHWAASHAWWPASPDPHAGTRAGCASAGKEPWFSPATCKGVTLQNPLLNCKVHGQDE